MIKNIIKITLVLFMLAGITFSAFNFLAVKSEAAVYWLNLTEGTDPVTGGHYVKCMNSGQSCVIVSPYDLW